MISNDKADIIGENEMASHPIYIMSIIGPRCAPGAYYKHHLPKIFAVYSKLARK